MEKSYIPDNRFIKEIQIELENIEVIVKDLSKILEEHKSDTPNLVYKTAIASFLAQSYNGVENILKRIVKMYNLPLPKSENWHFELFKLFCNPTKNDLPLIFESELELEMNKYRKFRHVFLHGYAFQLD
jgi:hypothetical protein